MLDFRQAAVFCLGYCLSKHKWLDMLKIWGDLGFPGLSDYAYVGYMRLIGLLATVHAISILHTKNSKITLNLATKNGLWWRHRSKNNNWGLCSNDPQQCGPTTGPRAACGPPQRFQWLAEVFRKNLQIWNMLKNVWGYICLTELLELDKAHLHKNNEVYLFCAPLLFLSHLFYHQIRRTGLPLTLRWGTCQDKLCVSSVLRRSLSWSVHQAQ